MYSPNAMLNIKLKTKILYEREVYMFIYICFMTSPRNVETKKAKHKCTYGMFDRTCPKLILRNTELQHFSLTAGFRITGTL